MSIEPTIDGVILTAQANEGYYYLSGWSVTYTVLEEQGEGQNPLAVEKKRDFEAEEGSFELNLSEILALENLLLEDGGIKVSADFVWPTATREFQAGKYVVGEPLQVKRPLIRGYPTINSFVLNERLPIDGAAPPPVLDCARWFRPTS